MTHHDQIYHEEVVIYDKKQALLPIPGLNIFKKLIFSDDNNNVTTEQYITSPLNLLKILIDRNEIRSSKLIERLHSKILQYAYSFEPNSMSDPTNLESITCFQSVIQSTQLIYAQTDTHKMIQQKYNQFVQIAPNRTNYNNNNNNDNIEEMKENDNDDENGLLPTNVN